MNACDAVVDALAQRRALTDLEQAHLAVCGACASLVKVDAALATTSRELSPGPALREAMKDLQPVKPFVAWRRAVLPLLWIMGITGVTLARGLRADAQRWDGRHLALLTAAWMGGAVAALWSLLSRGKRGVGQPTVVRLGVLVLGWLWFEMLSMTGLDGSPPSGDGRWWQGGLGCLMHGVLYALASAPVLWWAARRSAPASPQAAGAVAGLAAAYVGVVVLQLKCGSAEPLHVLGAHGLVLMVGALLGALSARRWLTP